jgi:SRSO17 transposase
MNDIWQETMSAIKRFEAYTQRLALALGHEDRDEPFRQYTTGLLLPLARKSVEPMAAGIDPAQVSATHQSLHHFVAKSDWSDRALVAAVRRQVLPQIERHGPIEAWIVDDTGFPKKGKHSVGVGRQYCGQLGKQDNCQVAVSLSVANEVASLPIDYQLYLPKDWADDPARRAKAGVPEAIDFKTKPCIALDQIRRAIAEGVQKGVVLGDAGYGDMKFQAALLELGLTYVLGIKSTLTVWVEDKSLAPTQDEQLATVVPPSNQPRRVSAKDWALSLPASAWQEVGWREGVKGDLVSRFAAQRVRATNEDDERARPVAELWLIAEWPAKEAEPTKYWPTCRPTPPSTAWFISPSCAGGSSATIKNSNRKSGLATMKAAAGAASIIMARCASPPMASWSPSG